MKNSYFLLLAAGCLSCLSVGAQNRADGSLLIPKGMNKMSTKSLVPSVRQASGSDFSLPDSLVLVNPAGEKMSKEVYSYTAKGLLEKTETLIWDGNSMSWVSYGVSTNTYDEQGRVLVYTDDSEEAKVKRTFTYEGNTGSYFTESYSEQFPMGFFYKGTVTYDEKGNPLSEVEYYRVDVNGDGLFDDRDKDADGNPVWAKSSEEKTEYDKAGRLVATDYTSYWQDKVEYTMKLTNVWDGDSKNYEQTLVVQYTGEEPLTQKTKYEVEEGNPMIGSIYLLGENGKDWNLMQKEYYYYPKGGSTANETIAPEQEVKIAALDGNIVVSSPESIRVEVYNLLGKCCYNATVKGYASLSGLSAGIYVVRAGKQVVKVSVR